MLKIILLKNLFFILFVLIFVSACKPTGSIITSKREAEKKGLYSKILSKRELSKKEETKKELAQKSNKPYKSDKKISKSKSNSKLNEDNDDDYVTSDSDMNYLVTQLINAASENIGIAYRYAGTSTDGFDCSGLLYTVFKEFDIDLPRSSAQMAKVGRKIESSEIQKGDFVFFKTNGGRQINHVGMVTDVKDGEVQFIHASTSSGVMISSLKESYFEQSFTQANRIL